MQSLVVKQIARELAREHNFGFNRGYLVAIGSRMSNKELQIEITDAGWENYIKKAKQLLSHEPISLVGYLE